MLGAAEELGAMGFLVDAVVSRQMKNYLPDMQAIRDTGMLGHAVVVHLGTNGPFSEETLDADDGGPRRRAGGRRAHEQGRA